MGTKMITFTVELEIDKDDWYDGWNCLRPNDEVVPLEFLADFAKNLSEPNHLMRIRLTEGPWS